MILHTKPQEKQYHGIQSSTSGTNGSGGSRGTKASSGTKDCHQITSSSGTKANSGIGSSAGSSAALSVPVRHCELFARDSSIEWSAA